MYTSGSVGINIPLDPSQNSFHKANKIGASVLCGWFSENVKMVVFRTGCSGSGRHLGSNSSNSKTVCSYELGLGKLPL